MGDESDISVTKKISRIATGEQYDRDSFDSMYGRELLPTKEQLEQMGEADTARIRNTPVMRPQDFVLNELQVPVAYDETYDPQHPDDAFIKTEGITYLNTYTKSHPTPSENQEDIDMMGRILKNHISKLILEPEYQTVLLDFLAYNVQYPGHKIRWAPLIQGGEGCGKGLLAKVMRTVMGEKHVTSVDPEKVFSAYNDWAYGSAMVVLNEIHSKGMSRYAIENSRSRLLMTLCRSTRNFVTTGRSATGRTTSCSRISGTPWRSHPAPAGTLSCAHHCSVRLTSSN